MAEGFEKELKFSTESQAVVGRLWQMLIENKNSLPISKERVIEEILRVIPESITAHLKTLFLPAVLDHFELQEDFKEFLGGGKLQLHLLIDNYFSAIFDTLSNPEVFKQLDFLKTDDFKSATKQAFIAKIQSEYYPQKTSLSPYGRVNRVIWSIVVGGIVGGKNSSLLSDEELSEFLMGSFQHFADHPDYQDEMKKLFTVRPTLMNKAFERFQEQISAFGYSDMLKYSDTVERNTLKGWISLAADFSPLKDKIIKDDVLFNRLKEFAKIVDTVKTPKRIVEIIKTSVKQKLSLSQKVKKITKENAWNATLGIGLGIAIATAIPSFGVSLIVYSVSVLAASVLMGLGYLWNRRTRKEEQASETVNNLSPVPSAVARSESTNLVSMLDNLKTVSVSSSEQSRKNSFSSDISSISPVSSSESLTTHKSLNSISTLSRSSSDSNLSSSLSSRGSSPIPRIHSSPDLAGNRNSFFTTSGKCGDEARKEQDNPPLSPTLESF